MRIYNRTNIPERIAVDTASLIIHNTTDDRTTIKKINDSLYYADVFAYPTMMFEIQDRDILLTLVNEDEWYHNMKPGEMSSIYHF